MSPIEGFKAFLYDLIDEDRRNVEIFGDGFDGMYEALLERTEYILAEFKDCERRMEDDGR